MQKHKVQWWSSVLTPPAARWVLVLDLIHVWKWNTVILTDALNNICYDM